jgi:hypothetical protein
MGTAASHGVARPGWSIGPLARPARIDPFHRDLIRFVLSWMPYGGPPDEELLPRFGITNNMLHQRILAIARFDLARDLARNDREMICKLLLALRSESAPSGSRQRRRRTIAAAADPNLACHPIMKIRPRR